MIRLASILLLGLALAASGQTSYVGAVDYANRAFGPEVVDASLWTTSNLRMWLPFLVSPTNSTTYDVGDCSPWRSAVTQTNVPSRPAWSNGAVAFAGSNYLDCGQGVLRWGEMTLMAWVARPTNNVWIITDASLTSGCMSLVVGTNVVRTSAPGSASSNIMYTGMVWPSTGLTHVALALSTAAPSAWVGTVFVNGKPVHTGRLERADPPFTNRTRILGLWQSANAGSAGQGVLTIADPRVYLTNLSAASVGAIYTNGLGRARP